MIEFRRDRFLWEQVAEVLRGRIEDGTYRPGQPFPSEFDLVNEFTIGRSTARKVTAHLRGQGLIYTVPRLGSFVTREDEPGTP